MFYDGEQRYAVYPANPGWRAARCDRRGAGAFEPHHCVALAGVQLPRGPLKATRRRACLSLIQRPSLPPLKVALFDGECERAHCPASTFTPPLRRHRYVHYGSAGAL